MKEHKVYHIREVGNKDLSQGYIGVTAHLSVRKSKHKHSGKLCKGREMVVLFSGLTEKQAYGIEALLRPFPNIGMNVSAGGEESGRIRKNQHLSKKTEFVKGQLPHNIGTGITFKLTSPSGVEFKVESLCTFCRDHNLTPSNIRKVAKGERNFHKGWKAEVIGR